jgi:AcrR family transcriptional regulator
VSDAPGLSTERIVDAAIEVIEGAGSLSMRTLAGRLGVSPMALYRWYPNKSALLDAVVDRALGELCLDTASSGPWQERAVTMASHLRAHLNSRRALLGVPGASRRFTTAVLSAADDGLRLVRELDRGDAETVMVFRSIVWHVFSFVLVVDAWASDATPDSLRDAREALRPEDAPIFTALAAHFGIFDADALFDASTRALVAGLALD